MDLIETEQKHDVNAAALWKRELTSFTDGVSIVGLKYVFRDGAGWMRRGVWLLLVLGGLAFMVFQLSSRIWYYMSHPTNVNMKIERPSRVPFPTVTLCNENRMNRKTLEQYELYDVMKAAFPAWRDDEHDPEINLDVLSYLHNNHNITELEFAYAQRDYMVLCRFDGDECEPGQYSLLSTSLGLCVQFNGDGTLFTERAGAAYGFQAILYTNVSDYAVVNSAARGYRVLIHDHSEFPNVEQHGLYIYSGAVQSVQLLYHTMTLLPDPYGDCNDTISYRESVCLEQCRASRMFNKCGCAVHYLPSKHLDYNRTCSYYDQVVCLRDAIEDWYRLGLQSKCDCPQQCSHVYYDHSLHLAPMSHTFAEYVLTLMDQGISAEDFIDSCTVLNIYLSHMTLEEVTVVPSYTMLSLLCDVGGALGLILGSTVLTLVEFVDFLVISLLQYAAFSKPHKTIQVQPTAHATF